MSYPPPPPTGPPFHQPPTQPAPVRRPSNGVGAAAATVGGLALVCAVIPPIASLGGMLGIFAVIVGLVAIVRVALRKANNMVVSAVSVGLGAAAFVVATVMNQIAG